MERNDILSYEMPRHVAIIMDGNGRWAQLRNKKRIFGHQAGAKTLKEIIREVFSLKIPFLSLYVFSVDNWKREKTEVSFLMKLIGSFYKREFPEVKAQGIKVVHSGVEKHLSKKIIQILKNIQEETKDNTQGTLNLCLNYGGRTEIIEGIKKVVRDIENGQIIKDDIDVNLFKNYLFQPDVPDVDLMIRTSGEFRLSDFLLWQNAYSEFWFTETLWPDFNKEELYKAIYNYQKRERRFGGVIKKKENKS